MLADLVAVGDRLVLADGGDGGFGNAHFKSSTNQAPRRAEPGWPGVERWLWLRLKLIAGRRPDRSAQCRQVDASVGGVARPAEDRRLPVSPPCTRTWGSPRSAMTRSSSPISRASSKAPIWAPGSGTGSSAMWNAAPFSCIWSTAPATTWRRPMRRCVRNSTPTVPVWRRKREVVALNKCDALSADEVEIKSGALAAAAGTTVVAISGVAGTGVDPLLRDLLDTVDGTRAERFHEASS